MVRKLIYLMLDGVLLLAWVVLAYRTRYHELAPFVFTFLAGNSIVDLGHSWKAVVGGGGTMSPTSLPKWLVRLIMGD
jgi:hypothetical protein